MAAIFVNLKSGGAAGGRNQFRVQVEAPEGTSFDFMDNYVDNITSFVMDSVPEGRIIYSLTGGSNQGGGGVNSGTIRVFLTDPNERTRSSRRSLTW